MGVGLRVVNWAFWSPDSSDPREWAADQRQAVGELNARDVPSRLIPAAHRRRMSAVSRMGVQVALQAIGDVIADFHIFCSRHGEIQRSDRVIGSMAEGKELSPTDFSLSVHNTTAGLFSIVTRNKAPSTSIASGTSSFASGWLEADAWLSENPGDSVLLVVHDSTLPTLYRSYVAGGDAPYALALLLRAAEGIGTTSLELCDREDDDGDEQAPGPLFLRWWLTAASKLEVSVENQGYRWVRH